MNKFFQTCTARPMTERGNRLLRFLDYWAGIPICFVTALFRKFCKGKIPEIPDKACIICQGAIGDLLLLGALIDAMHRKFPSLKITLLLSPANAQAACLLPNLNTVVSFSIKRPDKVIRYLRKHKYDLLIDASQWARLGAIISNCSGAKLTAGFKSSGQARHFGYDIKVLHSAKKHEKDNFLSLGKAIWNDLEGECSLVIPDYAKIPEIGEGSEWICLHMWPSGVKCRLKEWPENYWQRLAKKLLQAGYIVLLTGGGEDRKRTELFLEKYFPDCNRIFSLAGQLALAESAWLIKKSRALVSVNTGIMHLGALAGTATIGLHGPTNPLRWGPLGSRTIALLPREGMNAYLNLGHEYPKNAANTMASLPVEEVLEALAHLGIST